MLQSLTVTIANFNVLSQFSHEGTEDSHKNPPSHCLVQDSWDQDFIHRLQEFKLDA